MIRMTLGTLTAALTVMIAGCGGDAPPAGTGTTTPAQTTTAETAHEHEHAHEHNHGAGPHGGTIVEWGDGNYHLEFTVDHDTKTTTVYVLGLDAKTAAPVKADKLLLSISEPQFQVELKPQPQEGDLEGTASRFAGKHENLGKEQEFAGTISGEVEGTPYAGDFKE